MEGIYTSLAISFVIAYLLGSINFAIIISRIISKDDIREYGSKNAGATNMARRFGGKIAALTFGLDFLKGLVATVVTTILFAFLAPEASEEAFRISAFAGGFGALLGHIFPIYFGFKGGKGMATGLGVLCGCSFTSFLVICVIFVPIIPLTGYVSLASVLGAGFFPVVHGIIQHLRGQFSVGELLVSIPLGALLVYAHRENIKRLLSGTENKVGKKKKS